MSERVLLVGRKVKVGVSIITEHWREWGIGSAR